MTDKEKKGGMTVEEAGRLGGKKVVQQYGPEHMASIGRKGGEASPTKFQSGDERTSQIASKGGHASGGNFANDPKRAAEAGRKGGEARSRVRRLAKQRLLEEEGGAAATTTTTTTTTPSIPEESASKVDELSTQH